MFNRRRLSLAVTLMACLFLASSASADPLDTFTATSAPTHVKPSTSVSYTIALTTNPSAPHQAQRAKIAIPSGFTIDGPSVQATTSPAGSCTAATWEADGVLIDNGKINLRRQSGNPNNNALCPGATLNVGFLASSTAAQGSYAWTSELFYDATNAFTLTGSEPSVVVDGTAPTVTITQQPTDPTNSTSASFAFVASEPSTFECRLDTPTFAPCPPQPYTALPAGPHTFVVAATDAAGNVGEAGYSWTIDTAAPTVTITANPPDRSNDATPSFSFMAGESATFECKLDGSAFEPCTSPQSYPAQADGAHTFRVKAKDTAGNEGPATPPYTWTIDTTVPTASIIQKPNNPSSVSSPIFAFTASENSSFTCRLDGSGLVPCTSPTTYSLNDGPHSFAVSATDSAGNTGPEATHTWTIETGAPTAALTSAPSALSNISAATFAFSANEPSSFECALDDRGFEPCSSPATFHALGDGKHAFSVRARDAVGNLSAAISHAWAIDTTAPETTLASAPKSGTTATTATLTFSASENGSFECRLDGAPFALCVSPKGYTGLREGDHRFEVRAIDAAGNADATPALHAWKIQAPLRTTSSSALLSPRGGARVTKPPLLVWRRVTRAGYYNVQLFRGKRKILSAWPTRARLRLQARWKFAGRVRRLTPGAYRWYVWPGYGVPSARNYGQLLGQSSFVVTRSARR
jgi:hypothetical protein